MDSSEEFYRHFCFKIGAISLDDIINNLNDNLFFSSDIVGGDTILIHGNNLHF